MKIGLALLFVVLMGTSAIAQFSFGIKGGLNVSSFTYSYFAYGIGSEKQVRPGFHAGLYAKLKLLKKTFLNVEPTFVQRGNFDFVLAGKTDFNFIEVPLLISYELGKVIELQTGVNFASKLNQDLIYKQSFFSLSFGAIFNVTNHFFLSSRFNHDFTPIASGFFGWSLFASVGYRIKC